jgi:TatA/E family protein of Tat protein translocase
MLLANIFGDWYWLVLAIVLLFGGSQLPKLARNTGEAMKEFRKARHGMQAQPSPSTAPAAPPAVAVPTYVQQLPSAGASAPLPGGVPAAAPAGAEGQRISLTRAELDALLAEREARAIAARKADPPTTP